MKSRFKNHSATSESQGGNKNHSDSKIVQGSAIDILRRIPSNSVDLIVTDPPYGIEFMAKDWDRALPTIQIFEECFRLLKPAGLGFFMTSPRQDVQSRMVQLLEQARFKMDFTSISWVYSTGFPKARSIQKDIAKKLGREVEGFSGAVAGFQPKPAIETILVAMKPLAEKTYADQALANGKGVTWIDDCRIPYREKNTGRSSKKPNTNLGSTAGPTAKGRYPANLLVSDAVLDDGACYFSQYFDLDAWHDKLNLSDLPPEVKNNFPFLIVPKPNRREKEAGLEHLPGRRVSDGRKKTCDNPYQRGATLRKNTHPTVKPTKLMEYLITLGSRENDLVLDPFCGSGTTCLAAKLLNRRYLGIEINPEYYKIAVERLKMVVSMN